MRLHKVGDTETIRYRWDWHECQECGKPAAWQVGYLYENARRNPASSGYGKDDISWCSDEKAYACKIHRQKIERACPDGMEWCSSFPLNNFQHLGWYKTKVE